MDIKKFKAHFGESTEYEIDGEQFSFKPLSVNELPDLLKVMGKASPKEGENPISNMDEDTIKTMVNLIRIMVKKSYPNLEYEFMEDMKKEASKTDEVPTEEYLKEQASEQTDGFIHRNFFQLMTALFEINMGSAKVNEDEEGVKDILTRIKDGKSVKKD